MTRKELKEIIFKVIKKMQEKTSAPTPACVFNDAPCDVTTFYAVGEEG